MLNSKRCIFIEVSTSTRVGEYGLKYDVPA